MESGNREVETGTSETGETGTSWEAGSRAGSRDVLVGSRDVLGNRDVLVCPQSILLRIIQTEAD